MEDLHNYGILMTTFNDLDMSKVMHSTLDECLNRTDKELNTVHEAVTVDAGSSDGSIEFWEEHSHVIHKGNSARELKHLSVALNVGIDYLLDKECKYLIWIHADMKFDEDPDWITKMINKLIANPKIGKIHPECFNDESKRKDGDRPGNSCPWVIPRWVFWGVDSHRKGTGQRTRSKEVLEYYHEGFIGIGGREDWDFNNNILDIGFEVMITDDAMVWHKGMGTRERRDTDSEASANAALYYSFYGTYGPRV